MARRSTAWIAEMANEMKEHGVVSATRRATRKDGTVEEISLVLAGPAPVRSSLGHEGDLHIEHVEALSPDEVLRQMRLARKRRDYFDLIGKELSDEELAAFPDSPLS